MKFLHIGFTHSFFPAVHGLQQDEEAFQQPQQEVQGASEGEQDEPGQGEGAPAAVLEQDELERLLQRPVTTQSRKYSANIQYSQMCTEAFLCFFVYVRSVFSSCFRLFPHFLLPMMTSFMALVRKKGRKMFLDFRFSRKCYTFMHHLFACASFIIHSIADPGRNLGTEKQSWLAAGMPSS